MTTGIGFCQSNDEQKPRIQRPFVVIKISFCSGRLQRSKFPKVYAICSLLDFWIREPHMLTAKGKYSLKALAYLTGLRPGTTAQAVDIAEANNIPKKFLDAILGELRNAGIVYSRKGPGGGYGLARAPEQIKVGQVIRTIDGPLAPIGCASRTAYQPCRDCKSVKACTVRLMMTEVRDAMSDVLDRVTIADMVALGERKHATKTRRRQVGGTRS
jgi:Rrf2 family protein